MTHVLLLNGPPGCGKDSIAKELCRPTIAHGPTIHEKYANPIRAMICSLLGIEDDVLDSIKDEPQPFLDYATPRRYMIDYSEDFIKPLLGRDVWGRSLASRMMRIVAKETEQTIYVISDTGFVEEVQPVVNSFGFSRVVLVQLHRYGCSFDNDSRSYVEPPSITIHKVWNNGELSDAVKEIQGIMASWSL